MDRALDDVIGDRQKTKQGGQGRRRNDWSRGGPRKNDRDDMSRIDNDWLHDKYDDEDDYGLQPVPRYARNRRPRDRDSPEADLFDKSVRIRVENLHYDLTEDDLRDLFARIAPVVSLSLSYDRAGRSLGTAYVTYRSAGPAREAIREFDGANANGQPIRLTLMPSGPAASRGPAASGGGGGGGGVARNPFDTAVKPGRSLFERIERRGEDKSRDRDRGRRDRSRSPGRRTNTRKPPPDGVDRYVPGGGDSMSRSRSRSPPRRRGGGSRRGEGRRGEGRGGGGRRGPPKDESGRALVQGRPRFTAEELDRDMDDYWGAKNQANGDTAATAASTNETVAVASLQVPAAAPVVQDDGDIDMAE